MSDSVSSVNPNSPWRLLSGERGYWNVALVLRRSIALELGLETSQVSVDYGSVSADNGSLFVDQFNTLTYRSDAGYVGSEDITFTYTTSTGESGTSSLSLDIVSTDVYGGNSDESILINSDEAVLARSVYPGDRVLLRTNDGIGYDRAGYYGYDFYVTEEEILQYYIDNNGEDNLHVEVVGANYLTNGSTQDPSVPFEKVADGIWKVSADVIGDQESFSTFTPTNRGITFTFDVTDPDSGDTFRQFIGFNLDNAPQGYVPPEPPVAPVTFEGYDPINNWKPQRRVEINPGGPAADPLGDELVINDARGRLFGINNRASDSTYDDITGVAFVMGAKDSFDDGTIAGKEYVGTLEFDLKEGYRTTANFNDAQLAPISGMITPEGTLDGALVSTETGDVLALFEDVSVI